MGYWKALVEQVSGSSPCANPFLLILLSRLLTNCACFDAFEWFKLKVHVAAFGRARSLVCSDDFLVAAACNGGYFAPLPGEHLAVSMFASSRESSGKEVPLRHSHRDEEAWGSESGHSHCTSDVPDCCGQTPGKPLKGGRVSLALHCEEIPFTMMGKTWKHECEAADHTVRKQSVDRKS